MSEFTWKNGEAYSSLFKSAEWGDIHLIDHLLNKGLHIDSQDEEGNTLLHHAVKNGHETLISYLLSRRASVFIKNKKGYTALLEAYIRADQNSIRKITAHAVENTSIKSLTQAYPKKTDPYEQAKIINFVKDCKEHIRKHYINKSVFNRFLARHNERAKALIQAFDKCLSIKEGRSLIKNQRSLFEKKPIHHLAPDLLADRWAFYLKNKPNKPNKSNFYRMLTSMPEPKQLPPPLRQN
jgi:hypothetical protein